jgi:hypothetical protein
MISAVRPPVEVAPATMTAIAEMQTGHIVFCFSFIDTTNESALSGPGAGKDSGCRVTNLPETVPIVAVWRNYNKRAGCENVIKQLRHESSVM